MPGTKNSLRPEDLLQTKKLQESFTNIYFSATFFWENSQLVRVQLQAPGNASAPCSPDGHLLREIINAFPQGPAWPTLPLAWQRVSPFAREVLTTLLQQIPKGTQTTYKKLAQRSGFPRAARAVGTVMAGNPWPLYIPCHRVLRSDGGLGGFRPGLELKKILLHQESLIRRQ